MKAAGTTAAISLDAIATFFQAVSQANCTQEDCQTAPQLHEPEASVRTVVDGRTRPTAASSPVPFQRLANETHHRMSDRAPWFKRTWKCIFAGIEGKSGRRRRNVLPGFTTVAACCRMPISDNSFRLVQARLRHHSDSILRIRCSFSSGKRSNPKPVSISIPRKVRTEEGPSTLWCATGTPKATHVASARAKLSAHSWESGRPKTENRPGSGCPK